MSTTVYIELYEALTMILSRYGVLLWTARGLDRSATHCWDSRCDIAGSLTK
jgi:hypothetical protein